MADGCQQGDQHLTVGEITQPDDGNDDGVPDNPPDEPEGEDEHAKLDGNIYEITDD